MTQETKATIAERLDDLNDYIANGRILEAMDEFYDEDVVMQENLEEPWKGRAFNIDREKAWLATVKEWRGFEVQAVAVEGNTSFSETSMDFVTNDGTEVHMEQVSRAVWKNGRIVHERFYHA